MTSKTKCIFKEEVSAIGFLNVILLFGLFFIVTFYFTEKYSISLIVALILCFVCFLILNKKWFKDIYFYDSCILIKYPYNFIGERFKRLEYNEIHKIVYYDYMLNTPSHCKIKFKHKGVFRFNTNKKDMVKLFYFLDSKEVKHEQFNHDKNEYR